ncbi:hypothetical protein EV182_003005, partial [Spiromyces aspiralis]
VYLTPLLNALASPNPILSRKEIRRLFANFPDIVNLNKTLLATLDERLTSAAGLPWTPESGCIGDIFVNIAPFMKMYSLYVRNFHSALSTISSWMTSNPAFSNFLKSAGSRPECRCLSFQSYLLLPVQRIPRYRLLLSDLLRHTPADHPDHSLLECALGMISDVATLVNENIREHEMSLQILDIQRSLNTKEVLLVPGRKLIKQGVLTKICPKGHQPRRFYLFSDILLYSPVASLAGALRVDEFSAYQKIDLIDCKLAKIEDSKRRSPPHKFTIISPDHSFIVYATTPEDRDHWVDAINRAISECQAAKSTLQMDESLKRRLAKARRNTMLHFPRVVENYDAPVWDPDESADSCFICYTEFTFFCRRHHCRACGRLVCGDCSRKTIMFAGKSEAENKERRACDQCIASLFGREALESPPGTIHKLMGRSRHSVDPITLIKSLASLNIEGARCSSTSTSSSSSSGGGGNSRGRTDDDNDDDGEPGSMSRQIERCVDEEAITTSVAMDPETTATTTIMRTTKDDETSLAPDLALPSPPHSTNRSVDSGSTNRHSYLSTTSTVSVGDPSSPRLVVRSPDSFVSRLSHGLAARTRAATASVASSLNWEEYGAIPSVANTTTTTTTTTITNTMTAGTGATTSTTNLIAQSTRTSVSLGGDNTPPVFSPSFVVLSSSTGSSTSKRDSYSTRRDSVISSGSTLASNSGSMSPVTVRPSLFSSPTSPTMDAKSSSTVGDMYSQGGGRSKCWICNADFTIFNPRTRCSQ